MPAKPRKFEAGFGFTSLQPFLEEHGFLVSQRNGYYTVRGPYNMRLLKPRRAKGVRFTRRDLVEFADVIREQNGLEPFIKKIT